MNLSLSSNSVGFYQITKLMLIPVTMVINAVVFGSYTNTKVKIALSILLLGVGVATVTDVDLRPVGFMWGVAAVISTAVFQIWQGTKQKEFGVNGTQLQSSIAFWQSFQAFVVAAVVEFNCYSDAPCSSALGFFSEAATSEAKMYTLKLVLCTCFLALLVNFCSFGLIGRTGPITFQVVGHMKTCLVLAGGYIFFASKGSEEQMFNNIMGVSVAMIGVLLYGHVKHASSTSDPDCFDCVCPGSILACIEPQTVKDPSETEGLKASANSC